MHRLGMLRRAALTLTGSGVAAGAYGYKWANDNLGTDALVRIIQVRASRAMGASQPMAPDVH